MLQFTTLALLIYSLTGSGLGVSFVVLAEIAPVLLLAPLAGPLVDRLPRVPVMVAADVVRLVLAAALAVWHDNPVGVYLLAFGLSAGAAFFNPASGSLLPTLVAEEELVAANSGIWSAAVLVQVALAPLAGLLATTAGFGWAFAANGQASGSAHSCCGGCAPGRRSGRSPQRASGFRVGRRWACSAGTGFSGPWRSRRRWRRCPPAPRVRCWWSSPTGSCTPPVAATA